jgi:hypothetical protein
MTFVAALTVSPAVAQDQNSDQDAGAPLPAGHAAGVVNAPLIDGGTTWWLVGAGAVAAAIAIPLASKHSGSTNSTTNTSGH